MPMLKKDVAAKSPAVVAEKPVETAPATTDSGTKAAISRLKKATEPVATDKKYTGRDFDAEARGKVACAAYQSALASNFIPGLPVKTLDEYLENVEKAAERMIAFVWAHQKNS